MPVFSTFKPIASALTGGVSALALLGAVAAPAHASRVAARPTAPSTLGRTVGELRGHATTTTLVRIGRAPVLPVGTQPLAAASATQTLRVTVALTPRHAAELTNYAEAVSNPGSSHYREYLSAREFAARYGASARTIAAVKHALEQEGLTPGRIEPNHLSFDVVAQAGAFEKAMDLDLARVQLPDRQPALVDIEAPAVPASVAHDVQAIVGLDGLATMRSERSDQATEATSSRAGSASRATPAATSQAKKHQPTPCSAASSTASAQGAYTDNQIASAYNFTPLFAAGDEGEGVTVGVYELEPNLTSDIAAYQACYGTDTPIAYTEVDGGATGTPAGSGEAAFDIEQIIGYAPKASLIVYQGPNSNSDNPGSGPYDIFAAMISQDKVSVISNSWGECEAEEGASDAHAENTLFEEAAVQGQTVLSAAGDDGSEDCYGSTTLGGSNLAVDDPGSQPFVTDVGGTSLTAIGSPSTEVVWNGGGNSLSMPGSGSGSGAGGGGISNFWAMPSYQSGAPASLGVINGYSSGANCANASGDCREVPDVAADADPAHGYVIYFNGDSSVAGQPAGWQSSGGTSGAAPLWAGLFADVDADSACDGQPIGFANPALYTAGAAAQTAYFHDIASGNNDYSGTHRGLYPATTGYDLASGLGTPNAAALATVLCADSLRLIAPVSKAVFVKSAVRLAVTTRAAAGVPVSVSVSGLPAGVSYHPSTGIISGTPAAPGVHVVRITATDADSATRSASFVLDVAAKPSLGHLSLSKLSTGRPVLSMRLTAGAAEAKLSSFSIVLPAGLGLKNAAAVSVKALSGAVLAHRVSGSGRKLTVTLKRPATPVVIQFRSGALGATTILQRSATATTRPTLNVSVVIKDSADLLASVRGSVKPAN